MPKVSLSSRHPAFQNVLNQYADIAIEHFEAWLNAGYKSQYEYYSEGDGLSDYNELFGDVSYLEGYWNREKAAHQYKYDALVDLLDKYVTWGPYDYAELETLIEDGGEGHLYDLSWVEGMGRGPPYTVYSVEGGEKEIPLYEISGTVIDPHTGSNIQVEDVVDHYAKALSKEQLKSVHADLYIGDIKGKKYPVGFMNMDGHYSWTVDPAELEKELDEDLEDLADKDLKKALNHPQIIYHLSKLGNDARIVGYGGSFQRI
jgi:hypothetical protein